MSNKQIFNPLFNAAQQSSAAVAGSADDQQVATAAMYNEKIGECPKCKTKMMTGVIANSDSVYYCTGCRVSMPLEDSAV